MWKSIAAFQRIYGLPSMMIHQHERIRVNLLLTFRKSMLLAILPLTLSVDIRALLASLERPGFLEPADPASLSQLLCLRFELSTTPDAAAARGIQRIDSKLSTLQGRIYDLRQRGERTAPRCYVSWSGFLDFEMVAVSLTSAYGMQNPSSNVIGVLETAKYLSNWGKGFKPTRGLVEKRDLLLEIVTQAQKAIHSKIMRLDAAEATINSVSLYKIMAANQELLDEWVGKLEIIRDDADLLPEVRDVASLLVTELDDPQSLRQLRADIYETRNMLARIPSAVSVICLEQPLLTKIAEAVLRTLSVWRVQLMISDNLDEDEFAVLFPGLSRGDEIKLITKIDQASKSARAAYLIRYHRRMNDPEDALIRRWSQRVPCSEDVACLMTVGAQINGLE